MSIAAIGSAQSVPAGPEKAEGPGPDHDGDADDAGVKASCPGGPGTGHGNGRRQDLLIPASRK